ncbi:hypothetical protein [Brevundimonas sp.]|jgi:hypothetical protein|uniref:hypothetical protein n=1 Tax=Brevundimonas sp. TaxID=1871086 RepID=UPI002E12CAE9|nr:hypothetical protein [Brevundimonas sp.]
MSLIAIALAAVLVQDPPPAAQDPVYRVEDVVVEGRRLDLAAREYVGAVAYPARDRGPARWEEGVCVGVANFSPEVAQYLADRVSDVARSLGLRGHEPPCNPSILIIGGDDGAAMADALVAERPRIFNPGGAGMQAGNAALAAFRSEQRPVRWWHVSAPFNSNTGDFAVRIPGHFQQTANPDAKGTVMGYAPQIESTSASRLAEPLEDRLLRSFVIVDVDLLEGVTLEQLGDYVAFVALAQVDPAADLTRFDSILNLFSDRSTPAGFSPWDEAYLAGLYSMRPGYVSRGAQTDALGRSILDAYRARTPDESEVMDGR